MKVLYFGSMEKKNPGKGLNKIELRFAEMKQKMNSLKIKLYNVKNWNLINMDQVQMEY